MGIEQMKREFERHRGRSGNYSDAEWVVHQDGCGQVWSPFGLVAEVHTGDESDPRINGGSTPTSRNPATKDAWEKMQANARLIASAPDLAARNAALSAALKEIAAGSPPDDWEPFDTGGWGGYDYAGYGKDGDPAHVEAPDSSNAGDMERYGMAVGRWQAAKLARAALATAAAVNQPATKENADG